MVMCRRCVSNGVSGMRTVFLLAAAWVAMTAGLPGRARGGTVVFEEDFESAERYRKRWRSPGAWRLVRQRVAGKQTSVLDIAGGGVGLSAAGDPGDYELEADFRIVKGFGAFVFRARDGANLYFIQFGAGKRYFCPHTVRRGQARWVRVPHERPIPAGAWRRVRVEVRGQTFRVLLGQAGQVGQPGGKLELLGRWEGKADLAGGHWGFRCHADEHMQVDNVRITAAGPVRAELSAKLTRPRLTAAGRPFDLRVRTANRGWAAAGGVSVKLRLPEGVRLAEGLPGRDLGDLATGQEREAVWRVVAQGGASGKVVATVSCEGQRQAAVAEMPLRALPRWPALPAKPPARSEASVDQHGNVLLANRRVHLTLLKAGKQYVGAVLHAWDGSRWRQMAVSQPLGRFACRVAEGDFERDVLPDRGEVRLASGEKAAVRLTGEPNDGDGAKWQFTFTYELDADATAVAVRCAARADRDRQLLLFRGPELLAGEGSFGSAKDFALFGGLEYLEGAEKSSSSRDMVPAVADRYAPHPYKVTVPVMAVEADGCVTAVMWDPLQKWDGKQVAPSARFASPNRNGEANHRLGLFLPAIPKYVPENHDRAARAYPLAAGREIALSAHLLAEAGAGVLDAIDRWFALYGLPKPKPPGESYDQALAKCRVGYMKTMWDAKVVGTKHWDGGAARAYPNACAILWSDAVWCGDPQVRRSQKERVRRIAAAAMKRGGEGALVDPIDTRGFNTLPCHIRNYFLPLQIGHLDGGLAAWKRRIYTECIATQRADGTWPVAGRAGCRQGDQAVSGTIAELAGSLLMYARVTADPKARAAGLKALRRLEKLPVPRGAQVWEVPKFTPDILASAHAMWACLEAWQLTGERRHLDQAVHWARTGLPFVYMWQAPDAPLMKYGTIAVFGATHYRGAWFGRPVQWCGLVYAYWLLRLAEHDDRGPWRRIGQGIVDNGIQQMLNLWRKFPGTYTDWIDVMSGAICPVKFEPENLMKPILLARQQGVEVNTRMIDVPGACVHVSTAGQLGAVRFDAAKRGVSFDIRYPQDETSYAIVAGAAPRALRVAGRDLPHVADLHAAGEGWKLSQDGLVLVKVKHAEPTLRLEVMLK